MKMFVLALILPLASAYATFDTICPENKDPECMEGQMMCPGAIDYYTGCPWPGHCMDMFDMYSKDNDGNPCPNMCYTDCDWANGDTWCSNPPYNGCHNTGGYCMPKPSEDCYATCPVTCEEGEMLHPGGKDSMGCAMPDYCGPDPNYCPPHDPVTCMDGEVLCPGGVNTYDNCPMPDYCLASWGDCPAICYPPPCNYDAGEHWCDNGYDSNGCWMGSYCAATCAETTYA